MDPQLSPADCIFSLQFFYTGTKSLDRHYLNAEEILGMLYFSGSCDGDHESSHHIRIGIAMKEK
jgi:hypothetical protein